MRHKKGFVPVLLVFFVLAVSTAVVFFVARNYQKAKAEEVPYLLSPPMVTGNTATIRISSLVTATNITLLVWSTNGGDTNYQSPPINGSSVQYTGTKIGPYAAQLVALDSKGQALGYPSNVVNFNLPGYQLLLPTVTGNTATIGISPAVTATNITLLVWSTNGGDTNYQSPPINGSSVQYTGTKIGPYAAQLQALDLKGQALYYPSNVVNFNIGEISPSPTPNFGLSISPTSVNLTIPQGATVKAFDLTNQGANAFQFAGSPTGGPVTSWSPYSGGFQVNQTIPVSIHAGSGAAPGTYSGTGVLKNLSGVGQINIPVTVTIPFCSFINSVGQVQKYGDVDNDGRITLADINTVRKSVAGTILPLKGDAKKAADVNGDGNITTADADFIIQYYFKAITKFPVCP